MIPVLGSSRDLQVHSTTFALRKKNKQRKNKTIFWLLKNLNPAEQIDIFLLIKILFQKHLFSQSTNNEQPEFTTFTKWFQGPEYPTLGRIVGKGKFGDGVGAITGLCTIFTLSRGVEDSASTNLTKVDNVWL